MMHNNQVINEKSLLKIRLIGRQCWIRYSGIIFSGKIMNETKNTFEILTKTGQKTIPKNNSTLQIKILDKLYEIDGNKLKGRHEDRIKVRMKRKW